jgi:D-alanyl-lipoteichoic acid acyltransferase DltB (MBOAT superfamily)
MPICSLQFLLFCGAVTVLFYLMPGKGWRRGFLSIVNIGFLALLVPNAASWGCFVAAFVVTYVVLRLVRARQSHLLVFLTITLVIAAFLFIKRYSFLQWVLPANLLEHSIALVGLSYMLFKFIHMLVDEWQGALEPFGFSSYLNYQLAFYTLLAGPIQRYNDFRKFWEEMGSGPGTDRETLLAWDRILTGIIKMGAMAPLVWYVFEQAGADFEAQRGNALLSTFAVYLYAYPIFLYFNFSGYTDVVIGAARLLEFYLPENFNQPFLSRSVLDFWNRWHMSLTHWIRDYVFMTSYKVAAERFPKVAGYLGYFLLFFALFLAGAWHGSTTGYIVFGAINGLGAAVNQAYGDFLRWRLGRAGFQRYQKNSTIQLIAIFATFHYMCFSHLFFSSGVERSLEMLSAVGNDVVRSRGASLYQVGPMGAIILVALALALGALWKRDLILSFFNHFDRWRKQTIGSLYGFVLIKAVVVSVVLVMLWIFQEKDPVVVYMRF